MTVNKHGGSGAKEGRDSLCTPEWLADLLGLFDVDPCSNPRSHIWSPLALSLETGDDGLVLESEGAGWYRHGKNYRAALQTEDVFINPPYARGQVIRWVRHYRHTNFTFLLRWDPSTEWFSELLPHCTHVWFPSRRINFEPPPGVKLSSNPFPHALFLRNPPADRIERLKRHGYLLAVDSAWLTTQSAEYERTAVSTGVVGGRKRRCTKDGASGEGSGARRAARKRIPYKEYCDAHCENKCTACYPPGPQATRDQG